MHLMSKTGRNDPCPCGSGKKYKHCCLGKRATIPHNISSVVIDPERKQLALVGGKFLINQFKRDGPKIEASFDNCCSADLDALSELLSETAGLLLAGLSKVTAKSDVLRFQCAELMINSLNTFSAAVQTLRSGYFMAPGILARNIVETIAVVVHLMTTPGDLAKFQLGNFSSPKALSAAKKMIPEFGHWYGFLTEQFSHIGKLHHTIQPIKLYDGMSEPLKLNLALLRVSLWLSYITAELLFIDCIAEPRYWRRIGDDQYKYVPSDRERDWQKRFLYGLRT
jgi:hypothetical protein